MGSLPALPRLKRLQLTQDVTIVVVMVIVIVTDGVMSRGLRVTVVDDADDLTSGGLAMRVTVVVDGRKTRGGLTRWMVVTVLACGG